MVLKQVKSQKWRFSPKKGIVLSEPFKRILTGLEVDVTLSIQNASKPAREPLNQSSGKLEPWRQCRCSIPKRSRCCKKVRSGSFSRQLTQSPESLTNCHISSWAGPLWDKNNFFCYIFPKITPQIIIKGANEIRFWGQVLAYTLITAPKVPSLDILTTFGCGGTSYPPSILVLFITSIIP